MVGKTSSKEALNFFQAESDAFDLIITDMSMPEMPGDRLAMEAMKIRPDIPVIICSGHNDRLDADRAKRAGIKEYMMKPLDLGHFIRTIRKRIGCLRLSLSRPAHGRSWAVCDKGRSAKDILTSSFTPNRHKV